MSVAPYGLRLCLSRAVDSSIVVCQIDVHAGCHIKTRDVVASHFQTSPGLTGKRLGMWLQLYSHWHMTPGMTDVLMDMSVCMQPLCLTWHPDITLQQSMRVKRATYVEPNQNMCATTSLDTYSDSSAHSTSDMCEVKNPNDPRDVYVIEGVHNFTHNSDLTNSPTWFSDFHLNSKEQSTRVKRAAVWEWNEQLYENEMSNPSHTSLDITTSGWCVWLITTGISLACRLACDRTCSLCSQWHCSICSHTML